LQQIDQKQQKTMTESINAAMMMSIAAFDVNQGKFTSSMF
jgi:hypothetical protein